MEVEHGWQKILWRENRCYLSNKEKYNDFKMLKRLFINIYNKLEAELYFQEDNWVRSVQMKMLLGTLGN